MLKSVPVKTAAGNAPMMAQADYADISKLLGVGQLGEQYQQQAYAQPQQNLSTFLSNIQGLPLGTSGSTTKPIYTDSTQSTLGNLATIAGIADTIGSAWGGSNWLRGLFE